MRRHGLAVAPFKPRKRVEQRGCKSRLPTEEVGTIIRMADSRRQSNVTGAKLARFPAAHWGRVLRKPARRDRADVVAMGGQPSSVPCSSDGTDPFDRASDTEWELVPRAREAIEGSRAERLVSPETVFPSLSGVAPGVGQV